MNKNLKIDLCVSPYLYPVYHREDTIVVIIDILRATSAICTAFHYGVERMIPVASVEEALDYKNKGFLAGAERDGIQLQGFDFGNSPYSYMSDKIKDKTIVICTTNGTQAIDAAKNAYKVVIGAFVNITALCNWLEQQQRDILLLCSGWKNKISLEDTLFAGTVTERLIKSATHYTVSDGAMSSYYLYESARHNPYKYMRHASHAERLAALGLKEDIRYCLKHDQTNVIPILENKFLVRLA